MTVLQTNDRLFWLVNSGHGNRLFPYVLYSKGKYGGKHEEAVAWTSLMVIFLSIAIKGVACVAFYFLARKDDLKEDE